MSGERDSLRPEEPEVEDRTGTVLAGRYRVDQLLGIGGMGSVYRAMDLAAGRIMAVKVLHREMTEIGEVVARFRREAIAAQRIGHPNVTAASDFGALADGSYYLALEFVAGDRLSVEVAHRPLAPARALRIARQVALALGAAHAAGVVHRDLKPDNIMLVPQPDGSDFVKVLDFGIAKLTVEDTRNAPQLTRLGAVFGTPEYMAPEQARGVPVDHRADLYALGIILYEMLVGRPPFQDDDVTAVLQAQLSSEPRPLPGRVPSSVKSIVAALLAKNADDRPQSASELVERIDAALAKDAALHTPERPDGHRSATATMLGGYEGPNPEHHEAGPQAAAADAEQALAPTRFVLPGPTDRSARASPSPAALRGGASQTPAAQARADRMAPTLVNVRRARPPGAPAGTMAAEGEFEGSAAGGELRPGPSHMPRWLAVAMVVGILATTAVAVLFLVVAGLFG